MLLFFDETKSFDNQSEEFKAFAMQLFSQPDPQIIGTAETKIIRALRFDGDLVFEVTQNFTTNTHDLSVYTIDEMINNFITK